MWRATVLAAGLAVAIGSLAPGALEAQGRGNANGKAKAKASERFEDRDRRGNDRATSQDKRRVEDQRRVEEQRRREYERRIEQQRRIEEQRRIEARRRATTGGVLWPTDRRDRDRDWDRDDDWNRRQTRANAPAFCRSGAGHPVHGRQWCVQKGYGLGTRDRWDRVSWGDIIFGRRDTRYDRTMSRSMLGDLLGRTVLGRLDTQARYVGGGTLNGRWLDDRSGPRILQVYAGRTPLAEFVDANRDGRTDFVMINRGTR